ncbi:hypothetical protein DFP72DRAFT_154787 [Ephemerocybe angulata]|uniref:Uncharacterized protein n=1 Tax=Ephemerocybe angulata TaxID=980116 RepID=A0A8H6HBS3_9AGAR|nr:hypothetical protein DFP72DRAFT_154787 [Tulosesus angulatus]
MSTSDASPAIPESTSDDFPARPRAPARPAPGIYIPAPVSLFSLPTTTTTATATATATTTTTPSTPRLNRRPPPPSSSPSPASALPARRYLRHRAPRLRRAPTKRRRRRSPTRASLGAASRARAERRRGERWSAPSIQGGSQESRAGWVFGERGRGRVSPLRRSVVTGWDERTIYLEEETYASTITSRVGIDIATGAERTVLGDCPAIPDLLADKAKSGTALGGDSKGANAKSKSAKGTGVKWVMGGKGVKGGKEVNGAIEVPRWTRKLRLDGGMFKTLFPRMRKREGVVAAAA